MQRVTLRPISHGIWPVGFRGAIQRGHDTPTSVSAKLLLRSPFTNRCTYLQESKTWNKTLTLTQPPRLQHMPLVGINDNPQAHQRRSVVPPPRCLNGRGPCLRKVRIAEGDKEGDRICVSRVYHTALIQSCWDPALSTTLAPPTDGPSPRHQADSRLTPGGNGRFPHRLLHPPVSLRYCAQFPSCTYFTIACVSPRLATPWPCFIITLSKVCCCSCCWSSGRCPFEPTDDSKRHQRGIPSSARLAIPAGRSGLQRLGLVRTPPCTGSASASPTRAHRDHPGSAVVARQRARESASRGRQSATSYPQTCSSHQTSSHAQDSRLQTMPLRPPP